MNDFIATVHYSEGQADDTGAPVSVKPFTVLLEWDGEAGTLDDSIAYGGDVQFNWELVNVSRA